jgi:dihydrofolate reductase
MREVVLQMSMSVDGYVAGPAGPADLSVGDELPDVRAWKVAHLRHVGTHIMGRVTYGQMAAHWPTSTDKYAGFMNEVPKVVFSKSLREASWPDTRIASGDLAAAIAELRAEPGGEIMAHGGASFVQALSQQALIDEYRLVIAPVALGRGLPLFKDLPGRLRLQLVESRHFDDGTIINVYRR